MIDVLFLSAGAPQNREQVDSPIPKLGMSVVIIVYLLKWLIS